MKFKKCAVVESFLLQKISDLDRLDTLLEERKKECSDCRDREDPEACSCLQLQAEMDTTKRCLVMFCGVGKSDRVGPGSLVVLRSDDKKITPLILVDKGSCRNACSVLSVNCVSLNAPITKALLGKRKGDTAECKGSIYEIASVQ